MSAICGLVSFKEDNIACDCVRTMMSCLERYPAEYSDTYLGVNLFMGCRFKEITPESKYERLPYREKNTGLVITADAIIDNRKDLLAEFDIPGSDWDQTTDSCLILMAYKKWGDACPVHLVGDFAFAIYNEHKKELFCARDHIGKRTLYFSNTSDFFIFSTAIEPLFCTGYVKKQLNENWIANFLSLPGPVHEIDCNTTVYENVFQLPPATYMKVSPEGIQKTKYWSPLGRAELRFKSDAEYEEGFREVFFEAVKCRLRSKGSVGLMLSGGLDSGSVACTAAQQLDKRNKKLQTYCFIPLSEYKNHLSQNLLADETEYVEAICGKYSNIENTYVQFSNKSPVSEIDKLITIAEQPYKTVENFYWLNETASLAAKNNCSILLNGSMGNLTISYGSFFTHIFTLYKKMKLKDILKEAHGYAELYNLPESIVIKNIIKRIMPQSLLSLHNRLKGLPERQEIPVPVNSELAAKYSTRDKLFKAGITDHNKNRDIYQIREHLNTPECFSQIGMFETKLSLEHGLTVRDPTADKRVFEYCFRLPSDQYVRNGMERSLVRRAMNGIMPDKVRLNYKVRGYQSADWIQRIKPAWNGIEEEIKAIITDNYKNNLIDSKQIERALEAIGGSPDSKYSSDVRMLIVCLILSRFINSVSDNSEELLLKGGD